MTKLECSVDNCMYNEDRCCCKGDILVTGKDAKNTSETCCGSFHQRKDGGAQNAVGHKSETIDVDCEAVKCRFNEACKCSAERIGIVGGRAAKSCDTQCASFCCQ